MKLNESIDETLRIIILEDDTYNVLSMYYRDKLKTDGNLSTTLSYLPLYIMHETIISSTAWPVQS